MVPLLFADRDHLDDIADRHLLRDIHALSHLTEHIDRRGALRRRRRDGVDPSDRQSGEEAGAGGGEEADADDFAEAAAAGVGGDAGFDDAVGDDRDSDAYRTRGGHELLRADLLGAPA